MSDFCAILLIEITEKKIMLKCIHILHLRVVKYTKEKNAMNVEARERKKETLKFAILLVHWQVCMAAKNLGYKR